MVRVRQSALKHGMTEHDVLHAVIHALGTFDMDIRVDPPKVLIIGPDANGNLLEVIGVVMEDNEVVVIHSMPLRSQFYSLLDE